MKQILKLLHRVFLNKISKSL